MKDNWEIHWKDYYCILHVRPFAKSEIIEAAYDKLAQKYHPDINNDPAALQIMKDINEAYEILNRTVKRIKYDSAYSERMNRNITGKPPESLKPKPRIFPDVIRFGDLTPGETRKETFIIDNTGGPFSVLSISKPPSWLRINSQISLSETGKLPLVVEIEASGKDWNKSYLGNVTVKLDAVEAYLQIELTTNPGPQKEREQSRFGKGNSKTYRDFWEWLRDSEHRVYIINPLLAYIVYLYETKNLK